MSAPPRLTAAMLVSLLVRRVQQAGGFAAVLRRGDDRSGAILLECRDRIAMNVLVERATDMENREFWRVVAAADESPQARAQRLDKRIEQDPDLWLIELDIADAERFAAETIASA